MVTLLKKEMLIKDVVYQYPEAVEILEKYNIDYCCNGTDSLAEGSKKAKISCEKVIESLENSIKEDKNKVCDQPQINWAEKSASDLVDYIEKTHHTYVKRNIPRLNSLMNKVMENHLQNHQTLLTSLSTAVIGLFNELQPHLEKEEMILFPYVKQIEKCMVNNEPMPQFHCGSIQNPIRQMEYEHDIAGKYLHAIYHLTNYFTLPTDTCLTFEEFYLGLKYFLEDLKIHIHLENNILFPKVLASEASFSTSIPTNV